MTVSLFDIFKIGIGPSSSHTVGPMIAARRFVLELKEMQKLDAVCRLRIDLYGSLARTGKGHATDRAVILGLNGMEPQSVDAETASRLVTSFARRGYSKSWGSTPSLF